VGGTSALPLALEGVGLAALVLTAPLVAAPAPALVGAPVGALPTAPLALHAASAATLAAATAHASKRERR